jgi:ubiquinone/menaquinone biosynthesis C-methylase UbiE
VTGPEPREAEDAPERRPGPADVSRADRAGSYGYKRRFYQSREVAADYDFHRFSSPRRARRNLRKWRTILRALAETEGVRSVLDLPCGTGRFTGPLAERGFTVVGCDISHEMMQAARTRAAGTEGLIGWVRADAERLPYADGSFDCVISIRFLFHVDPETRVRMLREMGRVSRRWLILDWRHKYSWHYALWRARRLLRLTRTPFPRVSRVQMEREYRAAGLRIRRVFPVARIFSDKWIVLGEI